MLDLLQTFAFDNGLSFAFGNLSDLNNVADTIQDEDEGILFWDCYTNHTIAMNDFGYPVETWQFSVYVLAPSAITDEPSTRYSRIVDCRWLANKLFQYVVYLDQNLGNGTVEPVITRTDRSLDGVQLTATYTGNPQSIC